MKCKKVLLSSLSVIAGLALQASADVIPYGAPGVENPAVYSFTAANTGNVVAYFAGSSAAFENDLGLLVNGVDTGTYGLNNHFSLLGDSLDFGLVNAGDTLTFIMRNLAGPGGNLYSDPSLNAPYDGDFGHQHVYATPYTATSPIIDSIPAGTYVAFEDIPATGPFSPSNWNYDDEDFVFTNVASESSIPLPPAAIASVGLFGATFAVRALRRRFAK